MNWFLLLLGYFWLMLGICTIMFAGSIRKYYGMFIKGNHPKTMGALALLVGGLLISSGAERKFYILILLLGVIQILKGCFLLFASKNNIQRLIDWWLTTSLFIYRVWGLVTIIMGIILIKAR